MLREPQHERKIINDFNSPPFVLSYVEGVREFFSNLLGLGFKSITPPFHYSSLPLLPAAAQSSVELHHRVQLPSPRAGQQQLLVEELLIGDQNL